MDYRGQKLCEYLYSIIIIAFAIISFIVGYIKSDFYITIVGWAAGSVLAFILCLPDWPYFNRHKVIWADEV